MAAKTTFDVEWYGKEVGRHAARMLKVNTEKAGNLLEGYVVRSISRGQPAIRLPDGEMIGLDPSLPGEPPKIVTGHLRNTIYHRTDKQGTNVDVYVGANASYARDLEFGQPSIRLQERPFLRPALAENRSKVLAMMVKGLFQKRKTWDRRRIK